MSEAADFFADLSEGPETASARYIAAADGTRLRVATWCGGRRGTVLVFPGRNEHVEKYGRVAADLGARGWSSAAIDWRGQGMSDRAKRARTRGHVRRFADYQLDVAAYFAAVTEAGLPRPFHLLAHSMGGTIGLRALIEGLGVERAAFSAPMWGILMTGNERSLATTVPMLARMAGLGAAPVPSRQGESYLLVTPFEDNALTSDPETYAWMVRQARHDPRLALGRPTLQWLGAAMAEMRWLARQPMPAIPTLVALAGAEIIVDNAAALRVAEGWPSAEVIEYDGARHELMMERPGIRTAFIDAVDAHFRRAAGPND